MKQDECTKSDKNDEENLSVLQYRYIKELSKLKYEQEIRREQSLIQQASQMQTVFSFMTASIFMAVSICVEHRGKLSLDFFLICISVIIIFLIASLVLASLAQWRWKKTAMLNIKEIKNEIINSDDWQSLTEECNQIDQWIYFVGEIQECDAKINDRRALFIRASMVCFYCSTAFIIISFIIGVAKIV